MKLDEAIQHCEECAEEHKQLARWLGELKQLKEQEAYAATEMLSDDELKHLKEQIKKARPQLISVKQEPCEDCISRKSIKQKLQEFLNSFIDAYGCFSNLPMLYKGKVDGITDCIAAVENEPSIMPQQKIGQFNDVFERITNEILDEAEFAHANFVEYKKYILHIEPYALPDDDFRYGLRRAVEIINKHKTKSEDKE